MRPISLTVGVSLLVLACSADPSPTLSVDAGGCFRSLPGSAPGFQCALAQPCGTVTYTNGHGTSSGTGLPSTIDVTAARCVLQAVRDDTRSYHLVEAPTQMGSATHQLWVQGDGTTVVEIIVTNDMWYDHHAPVRFQRRDTVWFDSCIALTDADQLYQCLTGWWTECWLGETVPCPAS